MSEGLLMGLITFFGDRFTTLKMVISSQFEQYATLVGHQHDRCMSNDDGDEISASRVWWKYIVGFSFME